ncbi:MAG: hypothetical protein K2N73_04105, partial [Lachnospiraceae bacterium]|nr:hypothetical protein [Lachnospiraceae bacterium]
MSSEEYYLNDLLNSLSETVHGESREELSADSMIENVDAEVSGMAEGTMTLENEISGEEIAQEETQIPDENSKIEHIMAEEPILLDEINLDSIEIPEIPEIPDMELSELDIKLEGDLDSLEIPELLENEFDLVHAETPQVSDDQVLLEMPEMGGELQPESIALPEILEMDEGQLLENMDLPDLSETEGERKLEDIAIPEEELEQPELSDIEELKLEDLELPDQEPVIPEQLELEELQLEDMAIPDLSEQPEAVEELQLEDMAIPDLSEQPEAVEELQLE